MGLPELTSHQVRRDRRRPHPLTSIRRCCRRGPSVAGADRGQGGVHVERRARRRCPSRRRCAGSRPAACGRDAAASRRRQVDPAQRRGHRRHVGRRHVRQPVAEDDLHPGRLVEQLLLGAARPRASQPAARNDGQVPSGRELADDAPAPPPCSTAAYRAGRSSMRVRPRRCRDGEPEAGDRGQVERGLRVAGHAPTAAPRRPATRPPARCRPGAGGGQPVQRPSSGRPRQPAEVVELGEPEAGGVDRRRPCRRRTPASRRRRSARPRRSVEDLRRRRRRRCAGSDRRARSTGSPCATTKPIAASISTTAVTLPVRRCDPRLRRRSGHRAGIGRRTPTESDRTRSGRSVSTRAATGRSA